MLETLSAVDKEQARVIVSRCTVFGCVRMGTETKYLFLHICYCCHGQRLPSPEMEYTSKLCCILCKIAVNKQCFVLLTESFVFNTRHQLWNYSRLIQKIYAGNICNMETYHMYGMQYRRERG